MPTPINKELYEKVKKYADSVYSKPSAYKSGFIVKKYKELGGEYADDKKPKDLERWFKEDWGDIGNKDYPVYRPFKRVNSKTPLTANEIDPKQAKEQIDLKQKLRGEHNLPAFKLKGSGIDDNLNNISKDNKIWEFSNPDKVLKKAKQYLGSSVEIKLSTNPPKKYMVYNPQKDKWIHFGLLGYEDYTKHNDPIRRHNYLTRTAFMRGNWKNDKYSPNNLSRNILW